MTKAKAGDKVKVHFKGSLEDGTVFGTTENEEPFEFIIGEKNMLQGFENAVVGMQKGESKTITLPPEKAYGLYNEKLVYKMERSSFPENIDLEIGKRLRVHVQDGRYTIVTIKQFTEDYIIIDENDPLAGKTLAFKIELVDIL
jgi:peptidylprolyl isomerase